MSLADVKAGRRYLCPVCRRGVRKTVADHIWGHRDSIGQDVCPASGYPWRITLVVDPEFSWVVA